jgi:hypothetical protein
MEATRKKRIKETNGTGMQLEIQAPAVQGTLKEPIDLTLKEPIDLTLS